MWIISSRKDFTHSETLIESSNDDLIRKFDVYSHNFGIDGQLDAFLNCIKGKPVILLIHGYNNEIDDVMHAYAILNTKLCKLEIQDYCVLGYTWPGGDDIFDYYTAKNRTTSVALRLSRLFNQMSEVASLDVMTHSMGAHVLFKALQNRENSIRYHFAMASSVDNEAIERGERYHTASNACKLNFIFHSKNDDVLGLGYGIAEWDTALGYSGPEDPASTENNVKIINCKRVVTHHGGYKYSLPVFKFIGKILKSKNPSNIGKFTRLV